jgi:molecular chaperone Hsp33
MIKRILSSKLGYLNNSKAFSTSKAYPKHRDHAIRGFLKDGSLRFSIVDSSRCLEESLKRFNLPQNAEDIVTPLGNTFVFSAMYASFHKGEERIKVVLNYEWNKMHYQFYAESMANGESRGFGSKTEPKKAEKPSLYVGRILYGEGNEFSSIINLPEDFHANPEQMKDAVVKYFMESDQIRTHFNCSTIKKDDGLTSVGYLVQALPGCAPEKLDDFHKKVFEQDIWPALTSGQSRHLDLGYVQEAFAKQKIEVELVRHPIDFYCRCNKDDYKKLLLTFELEMLQDMKKKGENSLSCLYCNKSHMLSDSDFDELIKTRSAPPTPKK